MSEQLEEIKSDWINERDTFKFVQLSLEEEQIDWLILQAETLQLIAKAWLEIEENGSIEDADNFYTTVQDILSKKRFAF